MPFQETSTATLRYASESTYGTLATGSYTPLRITGESMEGTLNSTRSEELSGNRQGKDILEMGRLVSGDINAEVSYAQFANMMQFVALGAIAGTPIAGSGLAITVATATYTGPAGTFTNAVVGQLLWFSGYTGGAAGNNGWKRVLATNNDTTVTVEDTSSILVDNAGTGIDVDGAAYFTGTSGPDASSFSIQKVYTDTTADNYIKYAGLVVDSLSLNVTAGEKVTCSYGLRGASQVATGSATGTLGSANTDAVINAQDVSLYIGGTGSADASAEIESLSLTISNQLRERFRTGSENILGYGAGVQTVEGTVKAYFSSRSTLDDFIAFTSKEITIGMQDAAGNAMAFDCPNVKLTGHKELSPGNSQDVFAEFAFSCAQDVAAPTGTAQQFSFNFAPTIV